MPNVGLRDSAIKAKVSFVGSTGAILASQSYNVSGVSRSSTGVYTITFSQALVSGNYAVTGSVSLYTAQSQGAGTLTVSSQTTGNFTIAAAAGVENFNSRQAYDPAIVCVMVIAADDTTSPPTYALRSQAAHARVSFSGTTPSVNSSSINVSSVSRLSQGSYNVSYVSALSSVDHCVAVNSSIATTEPSSPGCMQTDALYPTTTQARFYAKTAGENINSATFYDPSIVEFVASGTDTTATLVRLRNSTAKTWAYMFGTVLTANSGISSTSLLDTGERQFNFTDGYVDYTVVGACAQTLTYASSTGSVTFTEKRANSIVANTYSFGENRNTKDAYNPTRLGIIVFGTINDFDVSMSSTEVTDSCSYFSAGGTCTNSANVTATPLGGTAPYTYQWSIDQIENGTGGFTILNSTSATATLRCQDNQGSYTAYYSCTVTDSTGKKGKGSVKFISQHIDESGLE